jgi:hypothetical protein
MVANRQMFDQAGSNKIDSDPINSGAGDGDRTHIISLEG